MTTSLNIMFPLVSVSGLPLSAFLCLPVSSFSYALNLELRFCTAHFTDGGESIVTEMSDKGFWLV